MSDRAELRAELQALAAETRAWLEWLATSGAAGVPRGDPGVAEAPRAEPVAAATPHVTRPSARAEAPRAAAPVDGPLGERSSPGERRQRLTELEAEVRGCTRCALAAGRNQTVFARGDPTARLCFVGEGPGQHEDEQGVPFVGAAGELLDRMIEAMGFQPGDVYVCNVVKCRPPGNRKPTPEEMQACAPYLREQLALVAPDVLVALGATALEGLLEWYDAGPHGPGITRLRGTWKVYQGRIPLMPTFHPAYLLRSPNKKRDVWADLQAVLQRLGRQPPEPGRRGRSQR